MVLVGGVVVVGVVGDVVVVSTVCQIYMKFVSNFKRLQLQRQYRSRIKHSKISILLCIFCELQKVIFILKTYTVDNHTSRL